MPDFVLDHEPDGFARIKVVGVGGGGCNAVDSMFDIGLQNVEFYVINSDLQALKRSKCPNRIQIGAERTKGRGCGASPQLGEQCMLDAKDELAETLAGADIVFVTSGLGGGTGTGAGPVVAQIAKELGILTVAVVTRPFMFEGPRRMKSAEAGIAKLRDACDTMIVLNNERLLEVCGPKVPMKDAFKIADNVLAQAVTSISDLVSTPGLINVDFNDIRTIMTGKGGAVMGVGVGKGENRAAEAVKKATSSPLLDKIVIDGATGVLICITGGQDMTLSEVNEATRMIQEAAHSDAEIIFGAVVDESLTDTMRVTLIATGFSDDEQRRQLGLTDAVPAAKPLAASRPVSGFGAGRPAPRVPAPAPAPAESLDESPLFSAMEEAPAPKVVAPAPAPVAAAPAPAPQVASVQNSLRSTLERMMAEQGKAGSAPVAAAAPVASAAPAPQTIAPASQPNIRVAKSTATNGGQTHPAVRPATPRVEASKPAVEEPAPTVSLFDPAKEETPEEKSEFDTPAFLRRRNRLYEQ